MFCKLKKDYYMDYEKKMVFQIAEREDGNYRIEKFWVLKRKIFLILYYIERYGSLDDAAAKIIDISGKGNEKEIRQFIKVILEKYKEFFCFSKHCPGDDKKEISTEILNLISDFQVIDEERKKYAVPKNVMIQITEKCSNYSDECNTNRLCVSGCCEMKWEVLKKIQTECSENNIRTMVLCGGEPLEYPYIGDLIEENNRLGIDTVLYTSLLADNANIKKVFQNKIKEVNLIICRDKVDAKNVFWDNLQDVFRSVSSVNIHCGSEKNMNVLSYLLKKDIYCTRLNKIYYYYRNIRELDKVKSLYSVIKTKKIEWLNESACTEKSKFLYKPCSKSGKLNMSIDVNGMVVFCLLSHKEEKKTVLGDIKSESLLAIWNRTDSKGIYSYFKKCIGKKLEGESDEIIHK